jgi:hypothetical protein
MFEPTAHAAGEPSVPAQDFFRQTLGAFLN